jgi:Multicopper oxidase
MQQDSEQPGIGGAAFPTDPSGLPEATGPALLELGDGEVLDLRVGAVAKRPGDATVRMLGYNGSIPGPTLKVDQGSEIVVHVMNEGDLDTTVHWHGLRLENRYDGVMKRASVTFRPRLVTADGRTVRFADGSTLDVDVVLWATGYHSDHSWISIPGVIRDGRVAHRRGVTDIPGLYFLGLSWQHTRGSALLGFIDDDAGRIADRIAADRTAMAPHEAAAAPPASD